MCCQGNLTADCNFKFQYTMATTEDKIFRINHCLCQFSNNGAYLAIAFQTNLIIKDAKTLDICRSFVFADVIQVILN